MACLSLGPRSASPAIRGNLSSMPCRHCRMQRLSRLALFIATVLLAVVMPGSHGQTMMTSWGETMDLTTRTVSGAFGWLQEWMGVGDVCPYVERPAEAAKAAISKRIRRQDRAVSTIVTGLAGWHLSQSSTRPRPLVLAFTGPTGVGKTETAHAVARAVLERTELVGVGKRPRGLLVLRGEDFSDLGGNVTQYVNVIKGTLYQHLLKCNGHGVVLFDEVQKVVPGTLEAIAEVISEQATLTFYPHGFNPSATDSLLSSGSTASFQKVLDTSRLIVMLVSDIGWAEMVGVLVRNEKLEVQQYNEISKAVKAALDSQWARLKFGKLVNTVVPFLPLTRDDLLDILGMKLTDRSQEFSGRYWSRMDTTVELREHLVQAPYIKYAWYAEEVDGQLSNKTRKWFAEFGARNLFIGGPMQALESVMVEYMMPWRPDQVLDIRYNAGVDRVEFRWCPDEQDPQESQLNLCPSCELMWSGNIRERIS